jgi:hypothetical protein
VQEVETCVRARDLTDGQQGPHAVSLGGGQDVQEHLLRRLRDRVATGKTQVTYKGHPLYYFYDDD